MAMRDEIAGRLPKYAERYLSAGRCRAVDDPYGRHVQDVVDAWQPFGLTEQSEPIARACRWIETRRQCRRIAGSHRSNRCLYELRGIGPILGIVKVTGGAGLQPGHRHHAE